MAIKSEKEKIVPAKKNAVTEITSAKKASPKKKDDDDDDDDLMMKKM